MKKTPKPLMNILIVILLLLAVLIGAGCIFINSPAFGRLPRGARLERIEQSPNYRDGAFHNRHPTPWASSGKSRLRIMWDFLFDPKDSLRPSRAIETVKTDLFSLPENTDLLVWFGHSSYLLQINGQRILVDPVFCAAAPVNFVNRPFPGTDLYRPQDMPPIDFLIITHDHWDHLDYRTVKYLKDRIGKIICPLGVGEHFERWGFPAEKVVELDWEQSEEAAPGLKIHCLPARHFSGRGLTPNRTLWASFLLESPCRKVYIGGDSGYDTHFAEIGRQHPDIDLAILENGQYNEDWKYIHTLPRYLGQAAKDLGARRILTVHHSKYALARHPWDEPLKNERKAAETFSLELLSPRIGEVVLLEAPADAL